jgi:hypothetical protein
LKGFLTKTVKGLSLFSMNLKHQQFRTQKIEAEYKENLFYEKFKARTYLNNGSSTFHTLHFFLYHCLAKLNLNEFAFKWQFGLLVAGIERV